MEAVRAMEPGKVKVRNRVGERHLVEYGDYRLRDWAREPGKVKVRTRARGAAQLLHTPRLPGR